MAVTTTAVRRLGVGRGGKDGGAKQQRGRQHQRLSSAWRSVLRIMVLASLSFAAHAADLIPNLIKLPESLELLNVTKPAAVQILLDRGPASIAGTYTITVSAAPAFPAVRLAASTTTTNDGTYTPTGSGTSTLTWTFTPAIVGGGLSSVSTILPFIVAAAANSVTAVTLTATVDVNNAVTETNGPPNTAESNNVATATILTVGDIAPVQPVTVTDPRPISTAGSTFVTFPIQNIGAFAATSLNGFRVVIRLLGAPPATTISGANTPPGFQNSVTAVGGQSVSWTINNGQQLLANEQRFFRVELTTTYIGIVNLQITTDADSAILESVTTNNVLSTEFATALGTLAVRPSFPAGNITVPNVFQPASVSIENNSTFFVRTNNSLPFRVVITVDPSSVQGVTLQPASLADLTPLGYSVSPLTTPTKVVYQLNSTDLQPGTVVLPFGVRGNTAGFAVLRIEADTEAALPDSYRAGAPPFQSNVATLRIPLLLSNIKPDAADPGPLLLNAPITIPVSADITGQQAAIDINSTFRITYELFSSPSGGSAVFSQPLPGDLPANYQTFELSPDKTTLTLVYTKPGRLLIPGDVGDRGLFNLQVTATSVGPISLRITTDPLNAVLESNDLDNELTLTLNAAPQPNIDLTAAFTSLPLDISQADTQYNATLRLVASGPGAYITPNKSVVVTVEVLPGSPATTLLFANDFVTPDGTWNATITTGNKVEWTLSITTDMFNTSFTDFPFRLSTTTGGVISLKGFVDVNNAVVEPNDGNNDVFSPLIPTASNVIPISLSPSAATIDTTAGVDVTFVIQNVGNFDALVSAGGFFTVTLAVDTLTSPPGTTLTAVSQANDFTPSPASPAEATTLTYTFGNNLVLALANLVFVARVKAVATGKVTLVLTTDTTQALADNDRTDNVLIASIYTGFSDLVTSGSAPAPITTLNAPFTANVDVTNAGPFIISVTPGNYIVNAVLDPSSLLFASLSPAANVPAGYTAVTTNVPSEMRFRLDTPGTGIPLGLTQLPYSISASQSGVIFLTLTADVNGEVTEANKANNIFRFNISAPLTNLVAVNPANLPTSIAVGQPTPFNVQYTHLLADAHIKEGGSFKVKIQVIMTVPGGVVTLTAGTPAPAGFSASGSGTQTLAYTFTASTTRLRPVDAKPLPVILTSTAPGTVQLRITVDPDDVITESSEADNVIVSPTITVGNSSLVTTATGPAEGIVPVGTPTQLTITVVNNGPSAGFPLPPLPPYVITVAVTSKPTGSTVTLAPVSLVVNPATSTYTPAGAGPASASPLTYTLSSGSIPTGSTVTIVVNVLSDTPGPIAITATADANAAVFEPDKTDNVFVLPLNVLPPLPDFTVVPVPPVPTSVGFPGFVTVSFRVVNLGLSAVLDPNKHFTITVAVGPNSPALTVIGLGVGAKPLGFKAVGLLSQLLTFVYKGGNTLPTGPIDFSVLVFAKAAGNIRLVITADAGDVVVETTNSNNALTIPISSVPRRFLQRMTRRH